MARTEEHERSDRLRDLFERRYAAMVGTARLLLGDTASAEDVVQDAFAKVHRYLDRVEDTDAYLRIVVVNLSRSALRRRAVARRHAEARTVTLGEVGVDAGAADRDLVFGALRRLTRRQREVLVLRYYLGLSEREIADALGIAPGSVKSHASRGLDAMNEQLGGRQ